MIMIEKLLQQAEQALKEHRYQDALQVYHQLPLDKYILNNIALIHVKLGELGKAHDLLMQAIEKFPTEASFYNQLANIYSHYNEFSKAKSCLEKAVELDPRQASYFNNMGSLLLKQDMPKEAKEYFVNALRIETDYFAAMFNLALCHKKLDEYQDAIACLLVLLDKKPAYPQPYFLLGKLLLENERSAEALSYFNQLISRYPNDVQVLQNIAAILLEYECFQDAKGYCESIVYLEPNHYIAYYNLGVIAEKLSQPVQAIQAYEKAIAINPDFFDALNNLGVICLSQNQYETARKHFEHAAVLAPDNESIQYTLKALQGTAMPAQAPREYVTNLFDQYADHYDQHLVESLDYQVPDLLWQSFQSLLTVNAAFQYRILDLGCGTGLLGAKFKPVASYMVGVDLSERMLEQADHKEIYNELIRVDIVEYLIQDKAKYDLILLGDVLIYLGELRELFSHLVQHLSGNGYVGFSIEVTEVAEYELQKSGRFAHSLKYIQDLALENGLSIAYEIIAPTRKQFGQDLKGGVIWLHAQQDMA